MSDTDVLITALGDLKTAMDRFANDITGVSDTAFRTRADAVRYVAMELVGVHLPRPSFHVVVDLDSLFRAMRNLRVPAEDKDLGDSTVTSETIRRAVGLLWAAGLDIQDAARRAYPDVPLIQGAPHPIAEEDKPRIRAALDGLNAFAAAVEQLREEEHTRPTFTQQGWLVAFYVRNMSLRIDTALLHLSVNDLTLDVPALVATVEAMRQVSNRFRANVAAWKNLVSRSLPGRTEDAHAAMSAMMRQVSHLAGMAIETKSGQVDLLLARLTEPVQQENVNLGLTPANNPPVHHREEPRDIPPLRAPVIRAEHRPRYVVSYAWNKKDGFGPDREAPVNRLCDEARTRGIDILRDKTGMGPGASIQAFTLQIARSPRIFVVLSDKYLRSAYCMRELYETWRECRQDQNELKDRVRVFKLDDADISNVHARAVYRDYWEEEFKRRSALHQRIGLRGNDLDEHDFIESLKHRDLMRVLEIFQDTIRHTTIEDFVRHAFDGIAEP